MFLIVGSSFIVIFVFIPPLKIPAYFYLFPQINFIKMIYHLAVSCYYDKCEAGFWTMSPELRNQMLIIFMVSTFYGIIGICIDEGVFSFKKRKTSLVKGERSLDARLNDKTVKKQDAVSKENPLSYGLLAHDIHKTYMLDNGLTVEALKGVSFTINKGEIFGLLGPNGAGKTTLLSILTGSFQATRGEACIEGLNISTQLSEIYKIIGVCPQFDCLWPELTVEEHFLFYIRLRGIKGGFEHHHLDKVIDQMKLDAHRKKRIDELSGGMRRRVSIGISIAGNVKMVFLDEPTTGLDPINRIQIWHILSELRHKISILLTTHLMDEADQLCDRVGIINAGKLICVDYQANLKNKYGSGYTLHLIFKQRAEDHLSDIMQYLGKIGSVSIVEENRYSVTVKLDCAKHNLLGLFEYLKLNKASLNLHSWTFTQCSLKDVFINSVERNIKH